MCGRFALYSDPFTLAKRFQAEALSELRPCYNVAPTQKIPIVREEGEKRHFTLARWGLIPHWAKDTKIGYTQSMPEPRRSLANRRSAMPSVIGAA